MKIDDYFTYYPEIKSGCSPSKDCMDNFINKAERDEVKLLNTNYSENPYCNTSNSEDTDTNDIFSHLFIDDTFQTTDTSVGSSNGVKDTFNFEFINNIKSDTVVKCTKFEDKRVECGIVNLTNNRQVNLLNSQEKNLKLSHKNKPLNKIAVKIMEKWFKKHIDNPYPKTKQKEKLALNGSITVAQVNSWFANRRNRSDNTKPKKNRKNLEAQLMLYGKELESQSHGILKCSSICKKLTKIFNEYHN